MELIPLKPSKHSTALRYPQNSINICALDFVHLVKESRCEVGVELTKHTCGRQTSQPITTEFAETENETTTNQPVLQIPQVAPEIQVFFKCNTHLYLPNDTSLSEEYLRLFGLIYTFNFLVRNFY